MKNLTLEQIQEKINFIRDQIELFFKTVNTPENIIIKKDRYWGQRTLNIHLRLDEFSIDTLENYIPKLKTLYAEYQQLRNLEKEISDQISIDQRIQTETLNSILDSNT